MRGCVKYDHQNNVKQLFPIISFYNTSFAHTSTMKESGLNYHFTTVSYTTFAIKSIWNSASKIASYHCFPHYPRNVCYYPPLLLKKCQGKRMNLSQDLWCGIIHFPLLSSQIAVMYKGGGEILYADIHQSVPTLLNSHYSSQKMSHNKLFWSSVKCCIFYSLPLVSPLLSA